VASLVLPCQFRRSHYRSRTLNPYGSRARARLSVRRETKPGTRAGFGAFGDERDRRPPACRGATTPQSLVGRPGTPRRSHDLRFAGGSGSATTPGTATWISGRKLPRRFAGVSGFVATPRRSLDLRFAGGNGSATVPGTVTWIGTKLRAPVRRCERIRRDAETRLRPSVRRRKRKRHGAGDSDLDIGTETPTPVRRCEWIRRDAATRLRPSVRRRKRKRHGAGDSDLDRDETPNAGSPV
jgi:hypothetical protein